MARDGSGVHTLPVGYLAVAGQVVQPSNHNPPLEDLSNAITESIARTGVTAVTADIPFAGFRLKDVGDASAATDALNRQTGDGRYLLVGATGLPIGTPIPVLHTTLPPLCIWADGRNVSRTTYAALFTNFGTTFGVGDGSTTFGMPDLRATALIGRDNLGGTDASRMVSIAGAANRLTTGGIVGEMLHTLTQAELPAVAPTGTVTATIANISAVNSSSIAAVAAGSAFDAATSLGLASIPISYSFGPTFTGNAIGSGSAHNVVQRSMLCNFAIFAGV